MTRKKFGDWAPQKIIDNFFMILALSRDQMKAGSRVFSIVVLPIKEKEIFSYFLSLWSLIFRYFHFQGPRANTDRAFYFFDHIILH